jgi:hypothetical protein
VFLDVSRAFDRVWHPGLLHKIKHHLPAFFPLLKSYISDRQFRTRVKGEVSALLPINSGVPQGSVLGPLLYLLFISDLPQAPNVTIGTFADGTVILTCHKDVLRASSHLQEYLNILHSWLQKWNIKINETKSTYLTFTLRNDPSPPIYLNVVEMPSAATVKYLGLHLDNKLNWKTHIAKKRKQMDLRFKEIWWLLGRKSHLSVNNKLLLYKSIIAPIRAYGFELWGCAFKSNIAIIQRCQSKILRAIVDAPWYVTNAMLHTDLGIPTIQEVIHGRSTKNRARLQSHSNRLLQSLSRDTVLRILKRRWPADL